jgi:hypothetical protein
VTVRVPFDDGPAALLVWDGAGTATPAAASYPASREIPLDGVWDVTVERTLDDAWEDLGAPDADVETWTLTDADGAAVHATFGARGAWLAPGAGQWRPAIWSPSRGIRKDPLHLATLGPSGQVPEEFLRFGPLQAGGAARFRTVVEAAAPLTTHLAVGAPAIKQAWLDGEPVALDGAGYLALGPVSLPDRPVVLELRFEAGTDIDLRAHFAFVADADGYRRPEWLRAAGAGSRDAVVAFTTRFELPADAVAASVLVGANGPCRVLLDGAEVGRQGGFDPYLERDVRRLQPYELAPRLRAGSHELRLELLDLGRTHPVALVDGRVETPAGTVELRSGEGWTAIRNGAEVPLELELAQEGDPAYAHAWRRPHPLPGGAWLEPGRATADPGGRVEIRAEGDPATVRLSLTTPPGAARLRVPLAAGCALRAVVIDGEEVPVAGSSVAMPAGPRAPRSCELVVDAAAGLSGGGVLAGPVAFDVGAGTMELGDWQARGLPGHSGAVRYRRTLPADLDPDAAVSLDLGAVRGTAEVLVDGAPVGVRVCSPYVFALGDRARPGAALEILVCNTLAPHLDAVSPTHYVFAGQKRSGLFGPVTLRIAAAA